MKPTSKRLKEKPDFKKIAIIASVILVIIIFMIFKPKGKEYNFDNLALYKNGNEINLSKVEKETISGYISRTGLKKAPAECIGASVYVIKFDTVELSFGNDNCDAYYKNNHTLENYNTILPVEFKNYIINLAS